MKIRGDSTLYFHVAFSFDKNKKMEGDWGLFINPFPFPSLWKKLSGIAHHLRLTPIYNTINHILKLEYHTLISGVCLLGQWGGRGVLGVPSECEESWYFINQPSHGKFYPVGLEVSQLIKGQGSHWNQISGYASAKEN